MDGQSWAQMCTLDVHFGVFVGYSPLHAELIGDCMLCFVLYVSACEVSRKGE